MCSVELIAHTLHMHADFILCEEEEAGKITSHLQSVTLLTVLLNKERLSMFLFFEVTFIA